VTKTFKATELYKGLETVYVQKCLIGSYYLLVVRMIDIYYKRMNCCMVLIADTRHDIPMPEIEI